MFLRATVRKKDGKLHRYFSVVENKRVRSGRVVQRHVLYLGEINSTQEFAWRKSIEVLDEARSAPRTLALFADDQASAAVDDASILRLQLAAAPRAAAAVGWLLARTATVAATRAR
jgi:hypothetical protein